MHTVNIRIRLFFILALSLIPAILSAHPHMFLNSTEEFVWDKERLSGCWIEWTFDQFFSADIIRAYDTDGNKQFSDAETKQVYNGAFINLKNYYYFTFIRQGKNRTNPPSVSKFTAGIQDEKMWYRFFIDLSKATPGEICLSVYDYTFFCDIRYPDANPVKLTYDPAFVQPTYQIAENKDYPVYYNPLGAIDDNTIYYTWKKGLQTYYPREIRITYAR